MKKFVMNVKTVVGTAPKTKDEEYDEKSKTMNEVEKAIREYTASVERMKSAAKTMSQALDNVAKAFAALTADGETPASMKGVATTCEEAVKKIREEDLAEYIKTLDNEAESPVKEVRDKLTELRKVESARHKVMAEYDTYRQAVEKKEEEYKKKGKVLDESKTYHEEIAKRDELKAKFDEENTKFKEQADAISKERLQTFLGSMKTFSAHTAKYFSAVEKNIASVNAAATKVTL